MSGLKKRKTTHHLARAWSPGRPPGIAGKGQSSSAQPAAWRPRGRPAEGSRGSGLGPRPAGRPAWARSAGERAAGVTDGGRARGEGWAVAGARPGGGPAGAGLPSRAPLLSEPREGGAKQL